MDNGNLLLAALVWVVLWNAIAIGAYLAIPDPTVTECLPDDVAAFEWRGHTCVRWSHGPGSDMECCE